MLDDGDNVMMQRENYESQNNEVTNAVSISFLTKTPQVLSKSSDRSI